jgi:3-keto-L-gulonate-6-phosphate decarboxylase
VSRPADQSTAEWAASLTVADVDLLINRCVKTKDMQGIRAALHLMGVKDPGRAEQWRTALALAVEVGERRAVER